VRVPSQASVYLGPVAYVLLVFIGTALLGFVVAPALGTATGVFSIDVESQSFFSLLTLKGVPYLAALSILSALIYQPLSRRRFPGRAIFLILNIVIAWLVAASIALVMLG
jgi:hypothetical protein